MMGPEQYQREGEGSFVFEYPAKFIKWYERKAHHKYARRYLTSTADEREKMAYADWCEDYK